MYFLANACSGTVGTKTIGLGPQLDKVILRQLVLLFGVCEWMVSSDEERKNSRE